MKYNYNLVYYGRIIRRVLMFAIKFIDFYLLFFVAGRQLYLTYILLIIFIFLWIVGSAIALIRRKIKYGSFKDRVKSEEYLHPNHDRRENLILLTCVLLLILECYLLTLPIPN